MSIQACEDYSRPAGVMGGPCLNCGRSQPEHVHRKPLPGESPERMLISGKPVPEDRSHTEINPATGMQRDYIVLTPEERAKGFVKPVRRTYVHKCGAATSMGMALAETYARNPRFYSGTFCVGCRAHFPLNEFHWDDNEPMDPNLQDEWNKAKVEREAQRAKEWREKRIAELTRELAELQSKS